MRVLLLIRKMSRRYSVSPEVRSGNLSWKPTRSNGASLVICSKWWSLSVQRLNRKTRYNIKGPDNLSGPLMFNTLWYKDYFLFPQYSSDTVSFLRPLALREASTLRPLAVAILSRKPCLFFLFLLEGWNVLFIVIYFYCFLSFRESEGKGSLFFLNMQISFLFLSKVLSICVITLLLQNRKQYY